MTSWKANRLRVLRAERRLTQLTVARRVGVSQATFSMWELAYNKPTDRELVKIAKALGVSVADLVQADAEAAS